jgi:hypothetical protein
MGCGTSISEHHSGNNTASPKKKITADQLN